MKIAIVGATGTAGRVTTAAARRASHDVVTLSRTTGIDLHTGAGLEEGTTGADVVIDTSNAFPPSTDADLVATFTRATRRLLEASQRAGVQRVVHLSICNIDQRVFDDFGYYLAKRAQEEVLATSSIPHTIIRSAQWMEFALNPAAVTATEAEVRVEDWLVQPIAVASVADVLIQAATGDPRNQQVAGPNQIRLPELTRALLQATGDPRSVVSTEPSLPALSEGVLLAPQGAALLGPTPAEWASSQQASA